MLWSDGRTRAGPSNCCSCFLFPPTFSAFLSWRGPGTPGTRLPLDVSLNDKIPHRTHAGKRRLDVGCKYGTRRSPPSVHASLGISFSFPFLFLSVSVSGSVYVARSAYVRPYHRNTSTVPARDDAWEGKERRPASSTVSCTRLPKK